MRKSFVILAIIVSLSLLLSACVGQEVVLRHDDPWTAANGGNPVTIDQNTKFQMCSANGVTFETNYVDASGLPIEFTICDPNQKFDGMPVDIVDAAMFVAFASPGRGDDVVVGLICTGKDVIKVALIAGTAIMMGEGLASVQATLTGKTYLESHSNKAHNPNIAGSQARKNIEAFLASMSAFLAGNGPDPRSKCGVTKDASGTVIRAAIWISDATRQTGGYLMWFFNNLPGTTLKGPWGGSYDITADNFDKDRNAQFERDRGWTWASGVDCNSLPGGAPTFLQAAQP